MGTIWDTLQNIGKWWSRKEREAEERMRAKAQLDEELWLENWPYWEDHRG